MKFVTLIALTSVAAITQINVDSFIDYCDKGDKDGELTKAEVIGCGIPKANVNEVWPLIDQDGNGKVSKAELETFRKELSKVRTPSLS